MLDNILIDRPLRDVFWFYGVIPSNLLWAISLFGYFNGAALAAIVPMFALILVYTAWIIGEIWYCADNVENRLHGEIARFLTVVWAINSVLLVSFLLVQRLS
jgi:hypothetical protein